MKPQIKISIAPAPLEQVLTAEFEAKQRKLLAMYHAAPELLDALVERIQKLDAKLNAFIEMSLPHSGGEAYKALDVELLDWVSATAGYGFLNAYDRFVEPLSEAEKTRFYSEASEIPALYGVQYSPKSTADFMGMMEKLAPRFEPHPIVDEFLGIIKSGTAAPTAGEKNSGMISPVAPSGNRRPGPGWSPGQPTQTWSGCSW